MLFLSSKTRGLKYNPCSTKFLQINLPIDHEQDVDHHKCLPFYSLVFELDCGIKLCKELKGNLSIERG